MSLLDLYYILFISLLFLLYTLYNLELSKEYDQYAITSGLLIITEILKRSPLANLLNVNDIIIEVQKTSVKNSSDLNKIVNSIFKKGEKTIQSNILQKLQKIRFILLYNNCNDIFLKD